MADVQPGSRRPRPPGTREPNDPPGVFRSMSPEGYITPGYGLGWRLSWFELFDSLQATGEGRSLDHIRGFTIPRRWKESGYEDKYGLSVLPRMVIIPYHRLRDEEELFLSVFVNGSKQLIQDSQEPKGEEIIDALRQILGLDDELHQTRLKWHCFNPIERYRAGDGPSTV